MSAEKARNRWISAASKISPGIDILDDDEVDFLAASMTSQKTICSDAFDFLFDSQNLNPDKIQEEIEEEEKHQKNYLVTSEKNSQCCVIS